MRNPERERLIARQRLQDNGFDPAALRELANGVIMDSNKIYLPAGKLSVAETEARERAGMERLA